MVFASTCAAAAPKPPGGDPGQPAPVAVVGPVEVIGSVEIVGQPFKKPFMLQQQGHLPVNSPSHVIAVPVPTGKRLVIETITVSALVPNGARALGYLHANSQVAGVSGATVALTFTEQGSYSTSTTFVATAPVTIRLNTNEHTLALAMARVGASGQATFTLNLFGYIEEL